MKTGKVILGILAGAGVGALLGMLFAPEKGSKTRSNIADKKNGLAESLKGKFEEFVDVYSRKYEKALGNAEEAVTDGKAKYNEMKKEINAGLV